MEQATAGILLYVEDEVFIQESLVVALTDAGYEVLAAASGAAGIDILQSRSEELRGLITDVNLGAGPDGWEVARRARELVSGFPVVYVSAASPHDWTSKGVPESVIISKPFAPAQVVVAISGLLNRAGQQDGT